MSLRSKGTNLRRCPHAARGPEHGCTHDGHYHVRDYFRDNIDHESPAHVQRWRDWFAAHGIDPAEVLLTHWVERQGEVGTHIENKIMWLEYGVRNGEQITVHKEINLGARVPDPFPVP
jgi:hypothetical protein